jgi:acetyl esterase/lipase
VRVVVGTRDSTADLNRKFASHLRELGIPHTFTELPGVPHSAMPPSTHWERRTGRSLAAPSATETNG